jgi:putative transposase
MGKDSELNNKIVLTKKQKTALKKLIILHDNSKTSQRAEAILMIADGATNVEVSNAFNTTERTVTRWRSCYLKSGVDGLVGKKKSGRKGFVIQLNNKMKDELKTIANSRSLPHRMIIRAKILILADEGKTNAEIANLLSINAATVTKWKKYFNKNGLNDLFEEYRPGRPRTYSEDHVAELIQKTLNSVPDGETHWSTRSMEKETGISRSTINRIWNTFFLKPHKQSNFKLSTDDLFIEKVVDVVGLYLSPPENAIVLCVDEKSQCQALERTQPALPMGLGYAEGVTENYFRHGTTTLFAALDVATGTVETSCKKSHNHKDFIQFLNQIKKNVHKGLETHIILDNYCTHKHHKVKEWLVKNPKFHFHFIPTYSSWLNQVERWFGLVTDKAIRRGSFTSVKQLVEKIEKYKEAYNKSCKPFVWTATAEEIFAKLERLCDKLQNLNDNDT